jgi:hypothetical protein
MKPFTKFISATIVGASFLYVGQTRAQTLERQVCASAGHSVIVAIDNNDKLEIDCTIGEAAIESLSNSGLRLTQGFQQPPISGRVNQTNLDDMIVWPNPTSNDLAVRYTLDSNVTKVDIRIASISGLIFFTDVIEIKPTDTREFKYEMKTAALLRIPGIYLVSLIMDTGIKVTKKFIKTD